jgi:polyhydroxyalkanoate synthesis regulator phasin
MKTYKIISGEWTDLNHNNAKVYVEELENGESLQKYYYGIELDKDDAYPIHKELVRQIKAGEAELQDNIYALRLAGLAPLAHGTVIVDGIIMTIEDARAKKKAKIRERINDLNSGYHRARADRNPAYKQNVDEKIDTLLELEDDPDLDPTVEILEAEDE